jgi:hypothetical protein
MIGRKAIRISSRGLSLFRLRDLLVYARIESIVSLIMADLLFTD